MDLLKYYTDSDNEDDQEDKDDSTTKPTAGQVTVAAETDASTVADLFVRSQPHVRGNWAGHIFVPITVGEAWMSSVDRAIESFREGLQEAGYSGTLVRHENFHLSLSRPFYLQLASIDSFVAKLQSRLELCTVMPLRILTQPRILVNDEKTRSFFTWRIPATRSLRHLLEQIDAVLVQYQQPVYYKSPDFHVSLCSIAGAIDTRSINIQHDDGAALAWFPLEINEIQCTFGTTKTFTLALQKS